MHPAASPTLNDSPPHPRQPWLALTLAVLATPLAFLYVGRLSLGIALLAAFLGALCALGQAGLLQSYSGFWLMLGLSAVFFAVSLGLPWWYARRERETFVPRWYNRWWGYLLVWLFVSLPAAGILLHREQVFGYASYRIPSGSMEPTIARGDIVVADTRASTLQSLAIGDLVVTESMARAGELYLRRIVAMGGQHVSVGEDGTQVDGVLQPRTHLQGGDVLPEKYMGFTDVRLEPGEFYLMGDNRGNSLDSHSEGPYEQGQIRARVTAVWWPLSERNGDLRKP